MVYLILRERFGHSPFLFDGDRCVTWIIVHTCRHYCADNVCLNCHWRTLAVRNGKDVLIAMFRQPWLLSE